MSHSAWHRGDNAVGGDTSATLAPDAEIGKQALRPEHTEQMVKRLRENPPAPFDLSQKTRVFSTKFQFVEFEVQGAEWTQRKIHISSLLLNADLPEGIQDILDTHVRPYQASSDIAIDVPTLVRGQVAYNHERLPILRPMRQAELDAAWKDITRRYLIKLRGFGWLIRRTDWAAFRSEADAYTEVLRMWVARFRERMQQDEDRHVTELAQLIRSRVARSSRQARFALINLEAEVRQGLARMRVIEPKVRIVAKNVSWESTRDQEFMEALQIALPARELDGWFEEFSAARERDRG